MPIPLWSITLNRAIQEMLRAGRNEDVIDATDGWTLCVRRTNPESLELEAEGVQYTFWSRLTGAPSNWFQMRWIEGTLASIRTSSGAGWTKGDPPDAAPVLLPAGLWKLQMEPS
ncbi:MAG TPA: hypothetical protein VKD22_17160 [Ramlibacter sp.]|nr:hypothetical protein [Ramlibacter sp.]